MTITTLTSREFKQRVNDAKRAASHGPVFITDRGKPAHVLLTFENYQRLTNQLRNIADALAMSEVAEIDFDPSRANIQSQPVDFS